MYAEYDDKKKRKTKPFPTFKLLQEVNNGVVYFGRKKVIKGHTTAMFICPKCGELWRCKISDVVAGRARQCCD